MPSLKKLCECFLSVSLDKSQQVCCTLFEFRVITLVRAILCALTMLGMLDVADWTR